MAKYVLEYRRKTADGFVHVKNTTELTGKLSEYLAGRDDETDGLEFFTVRLVKPKPEHKKVEVKK